jgi:drug/metabolite transporter (DMT)-like permease
MLLSVLGVAFLLDPLGATSSSPIGIGVAAIAAISFGAYLVLARRFVRDYHLPPATPSLALVIGLAAMSLPAVILAEGTSGLAPSVSATGGAALAWLVLISGVAPLILTEAAVRLLPTRRTSPYMFLAPIVGTALSVPLLGITLPVAELVGGALAVAGVLFATWPDAPQHS